MTAKGMTMPKLKMAMEVNVDARNHEAAKREVSDAVDTLKSDTEGGRRLIASFKVALLRLIDEAHDGRPTTLSEQIVALRDLAIQALEIDGIADRGAMDEDADTNGFGGEEPRITLAYSIEKTATPWQAMVIYEGGMGDIPLCSGNNEATPEEAVASLRDELLPEVEWVRP